MQRLKNSTENGITRALVYGIGFGYGGAETPVAVTIINYSDKEAIRLASRSLPHGLSLIGVVEFDSDEDQDVYAVRYSLISSNT